MPSFAPLRPGDPETLGGLTLIGRLGEGGQGVVYLGRDPAGRNLAVKWLRPDLSGDEVSVSRFLREVQVAQQVAPFCTAAVLGTGVESDRPFIVSEYIEGPSLQQVSQEEGPRTGSALHRLAVGTATALAAIHQAGIVHRDFKPANVLLGADGPRVIDFGIARALNATSTISSMPVGTPSYMPPEQIMGHTVGPAADLFSWAATIVFAASGRPPFGSDTMHAVINRVLNQPPDLGGLDGPLGGVVAACLSKNPAQRPTAEQVLMRLLQNPVANPAMLAEAAAAAAAPAPPWQPAPAPGPWSSGPAYGPAPTTHPGMYPPPQPPPPPPPRNRTPIVVGSTVAVALLMLAGLVLVIRGNQTPVTPQANVSTRTATPGRSQSPSRAVPATGTKKALPGGAISLYENPADPITLTSYEVYSKSSDDWIDYARNSLQGKFVKYAGNWESLVSPDGHYLASRNRNYTSDDYDSVIITDRRTGIRNTIKTVKDPLISSIRSWSKDGSRILLDIEKETGKDKWSYLGFVLVDTATKRAKVVNVADTSIRSTAFGWDGDGGRGDGGVVNVSGKSLRFFGQNGKADHDVKAIGTLASGTQDIFSPSGKAFATNCGGEGTTCLWNSATGARTRQFTSDCDKMLGWYDETHLFCWEQDNEANDEIQVVDFDGHLVRKLVEVPDDLDMSPVFTVNPAPGS